MHHLTDTELLYRILVGFAVSFVIGFERELRGSNAGDRTFSLIGGAAACAAAVTGVSSPQALAGIVTGVGFLGAGLILRTATDSLHGVTTAATVFAVAVVGLVVGLGHLVIGAVVGALVVATLEIRYIPVLKILDARRYARRFTQDGAAPR